DVDDEEVSVLRRNNAALAVVVVLANAIGNLERLLAAEDRCAAVSQLLRAVPVLVILPRPVEMRHLLAIGLGLLQAEHIRARSAQEVHKALVHRRAHTVYIPRDQSHAGSI